MTNLVTEAQVAEAIESLDDYARMMVGVDPSGPRELLYRYLEQAKLARADTERTARNRDMWKGQCERQAAELEALRPDAERYRWLRDNLDSDWAICEWNTEDSDGIGYYRDARAPAVVDAAIDAARLSHPSAA